MAGYQFGHMGTYSRKGNSVGRSIRQVCDEAGRADGAAPHVEHPEPPVILDGCDPKDLPGIIDAEIEAAKAERAGGRGGGIRRDTHSLEGLVLSYPVPWDRINADPAEKAKYERWRDDAAKWGKADQDRRGVETRSTVEHRDEKQPHVHVLGVPRNARKDAKVTHPGHAAASHTKGQGGDAQAQKRAYRESMRTWQDTMHTELGARHGQARTGPGRTRQTRDEWKATQREAERLAERTASLDRAEQMVEQKAEAKAAAIVETKRQEIQAEAARLVAAAHDQAEAIRAQATREAAAVAERKASAEAHIKAQVDAANAKLATERQRIAASVEAEKKAKKEALKAREDATAEAQNARAQKAEAEKAIAEAPERARQEVARLSAEATACNQRAAAYSGAMVAGLEAYGAGKMEPGQTQVGGKGFRWASPAAQAEIWARIEPAWEAVWDTCHRLAERSRAMVGEARVVIDQALALKAFLPAAQRAQAEALAERTAAEQRRQAALVAKPVVAVPTPPRRRAQNTL